MKTGYSIKTWKFQLRCPHPEWLKATEDYYREVLNFYFQLLLQKEELWGQGSFQIQRELECLTLAGRDGREPVYPLPFPKVPLYLRRSAINKAAANLKAHVSRLGNADDKRQHGVPENIEASVTYYKGMYRDFCGGKISLKVWDGSKWHWMDCRLKGQDIPEDGEILSPSIVLEDKFCWLHVPVKQENADARTAKERIKSGDNVCSVQFTNTDIFAVCCAMDANGKQLAVHNCRGGDNYRHQCRKLTQKISKSREYTDRDNVEKPNKKYYMHLKHLSEYAAHKASREIVDFCVEQKVKVLILPAYNEDFSRIVQYRSGNFSPLHLSGRIREYLGYKAWEAGIVLLECRADHVSSRCAVCGGSVKKKGSQFECENGHQGSRFLNSARNLGVKCLEDFKGKRERRIKSEKKKELLSTDCDDSD